MESIIDILHKGGYSCVMKNREEVRTFTQRGVADLYDLYQADSAFMKGAAIADKVINRKTFRDSFSNHFVSVLHLLTQNKL